MKRVEENNFGLIEMSVAEMQNTTGGRLWGVLREVVGAFVGSISDFCSGVKQGYNDARMQRIIDTSQRIA